jgi:hypothetical protein
LDIVIQGLRDKSQQIRFLVYSLLSNAFYTNSDDFKKTIRVYIESLEYKEDKLKIFESIRLLCRNNLSHIDNSFMYSILNIDKNFLISEYRWNDLAYNANLLILQEYLLNNQLQGSLYIPYFFIKHFHYLSERYPGIFEKSIKELLADKYYSINREGIGLIIEIKERYSFEVVEIGDVSKYDNNDLTKTYLDILSYLKAFVKNVIPLQESFKSITNIFDLLSRINLKLYLTVLGDTDKADYSEIIRFNEILFEIFLYHIQLRKGIPDLSDIKFDSLNKFKAIANYTDESSLVRILQELALILGNEKLPKLTINQPKKNYQYECNRALSNTNKATPFFLNIIIKLKGIKPTLNKQAYFYIMKNLSLKLTDHKDTKYHFYHSDIGHRDNYILIKKTICLYITKNEKFNLGLFLNNTYKTQLHNILNTTCEPVDNIAFNILK